MAKSGQVKIVATLGTAQMLAWGSTYYLPAMLAEPMARDVGMPVSMVFAAFSLSLIVTALAGPAAGKAIDHWGGRPVLLASSLLFAIGLAGLGIAQGPVLYFAAWVVLGLGMACGLYEAAFSALVWLYGHGSRSAITGIALLGGLASTVGWPLSTWMEVEIGWRGACFVWAALHLLLGLPLNAMVPKIAAGATPIAASLAAPITKPLSATQPDKTSSHDTTESATATATTMPEREARRATLLLALVFAITWFISTAMAAHLPRLLQASGTSLAATVAIGAMVGPAQVAGRLLEFGLLRRIHPLFSARLAALMHPVGATVLLISGAGLVTIFAPIFAILHGIGNGILTIAKGVLPLALFGPSGYGARQGWLMVPARIAQAFAPVLFGLCLDLWGAGALWISTGLGLVAFVALMWLRTHRQH